MLNTLKIQKPQLVYEKMYEKNKKNYKEERYENYTSQRFENFTWNHPYISYVLIIACMPICVILAVGLITTL
ncbi:MAG: hypothetical protein RSA27_07835, partial [Oscillospiraceae bacterium]